MRKVLGTGTHISLMLGARCLPVQAGTVENRRRSADLEVRLTVRVFGQ